MKIVVVGGTGLIGWKVMARLGERGHEAIAAYPGIGVTTLPHSGLEQALKDASVVIDASDPPGFADAEVLEFFETSTRTLLAAEEKAGVGHHVALSAVGTGRLPGSGYLRAKAAQERLIEESPIPFSIVRATQLFETVPSIADAATEDGTVRVPPVAFQPVACDDVARVLTRIAVESPLNGPVEIAGPERFRMDEFFRQVLRAWDDPRAVVTDPHARLFGAVPEEGSLVPGEDAILGGIRYADWPGRTRGG